MILRGIALELGKMDENVQRGGDVISDKKMSLQIFCILNGIFWS